MISQTPENEPELLKKIAEGSDSAFSEVYYFYNKTVYNTVMTYVKDEVVAQEIVQEIFVKLWERKATFARVDSFRDYFFITVRNYVFDYFNKLSRQAKLLDKLKEYQPKEEGISDGDFLLLDRQYGQMVANAIGQLPVRQKEVYLLSEKGDMNFDQIAERLGLSRSTVKKHLELARKSVRNYVSNHLQENLSLVTPGLLSLLHFLIH